MSEGFRPISGISRTLHYALLLCALAAWADGVWPVAVPRDWLDHRVLGLTTAFFMMAGWFRAVREGTFGIWRDSSRCVLGDVRAMARGGGGSAETWEHLLPVYIPVVLVAAAVVALTGLPSLYRLDSVFQPLAWVLYARRIHAVAGYALAFVCVIEFISFGIAVLPGAGVRRPISGPGAV